MATSSIFANIKITEPKKVEAFVATLDVSIADSMPPPDTPRKTVLSNPDVIRKLWDKRKNESIYGDEYYRFDRFSRRE